MSELLAGFMGARQRDKKWKLSGEKDGEGSQI